MRLMNEDELNMVSGGGRTVSRPPTVDKGGTLPADDCPVYEHYYRGLSIGGYHEIKHDCINCYFYDYGISNKCTNPKGIRFGK